MTKNLSKIFEKLEISLEQQHRSMSEESNPVLVRLKSNHLASSAAMVVLGQYSLLPATIVEFLQIGANRLHYWPEIKTELERNIGEELGSRTAGLSHYSILKDALVREVGVDVSDIRSLSCTNYFLTVIRRGLSERSPAFITGMLYALEDSAIPELGIVASVINMYADLIGQPNEPINLSALREKKRSADTPRNASGPYTLDVFFAAHMLDFEVGHQKRLASALKEYINSPTDIQNFEDGFEFVLAEMDLWWDALAQVTNETATFPSSYSTDSSNLVNGELAETLS